MQRGLERAGAAREEILVVEDNELSAHRVRAALSGADRFVTVVGSGREALASLADQAPSLIVVSLDLPDMPGTAILDALREHSRGAPMIAVSGSPNVDLAVRAGRLGASEVLTRPVNPRQISQ